MTERKTTKTHKVNISLDDHDHALLAELRDRRRQVNTVILCQLIREAVASDRRKAARYAQ